MTHVDSDNIGHGEKGCHAGAYLGGEAGILDFIWLVKSVLNGIVAKGGQYMTRAIEVEVSAHNRGRHHIVEGGLVSLEETHSRKR